MLPNELQLIKNVQAGDTADFGQIYDHYIEPIYRFVYFKTHHTQMAEDLTSDIFVKALERISSFDADKGPFTAWLYQIARNTIIDQYRKQRPTVAIEDAWDLPSDSGVERGVEERILMERLRVIMEGMSADMRDVLVLRIWQGLSHREVSAILGKNEANCKKIYSRAVEKMKVTLPELLALLLLFYTTHHS